MGKASTNTTGTLAGQDAPLVSRRVLVKDRKIVVRNRRVVTTDDADCCCTEETQPDPFTVVVTIDETAEDNLDDFYTFGPVKSIERRYSRILKLKYTIRLTLDTNGTALVEDIAPGGSCSIETVGYQKTWNSLGVLSSNVSLTGSYNATVSVPTGYRVPATGPIGTGLATCSKPTAAGCQPSTAGHALFPPSGLVDWTLSGRIHRSLSSPDWGRYGLAKFCPSNGFVGSTTNGPITETWSASVTNSAYRMNSSYNRAEQFGGFGGGMLQTAILKMSFVAGPGFDCGPSGLRLVVPVPPRESAMKILDAYFRGK